MTSYRITPLSVSVHLPTHSPVYGESAIHVRIEDEAAGPFVVLTQIADPKPGVVSVDVDQLEAVLKAAKTLMAAQPKEE